MFYCRVLLFVPLFMCFILSSLVLYSLSLSLFVIVILFYIVLSDLLVWILECFICGVLLFVPLFICSLIFYLSLSCLLFWMQVHMLFAGAVLLKWVFIYSIYMHHYLSYIINIYYYFIFINFPISLSLNHSTIDLIFPSYFSFQQRRSAINCQ